MNPDTEGPMSEHPRSTDTTVEAAELTYCEPPSNKFYRTFVLGDRWIAQWGRIGTVGQFKVTATPSGDAAETQATAQRASKEAKGYSPVASATFIVPASWATNPTAHTAELDDLFRNHRQLIAAPPHRATAAPQPSAAPIAAPATPVMGDMEARLQAALAKAKAAQQ
jgi:predicted DNA-binding WGR domain protein